MIALASLLFVFLPPLLIRVLMPGSLAPTVAHEVLCELGIAYLFLKNRNFVFGDKIIFIVAFVFLAIADLTWGFTSSTELTNASLGFGILAREFSYMGFATALAVGLVRIYRAQLRSWTSLVVLLPMFVFLTLAGHYLIVAEKIANTPDIAWVLVYTASIYNLARALALSIVIQQLFKEDGGLRFVFLCSIVLMFTCDIGLTDIFFLGSQPGINTGFEVGWQVSVASMFVVAFLGRHDSSIFGNSQLRSLKSLRTLLITFVVFTLMLHTAALWYFGFLKVSSLPDIIQLVVLSLVSWVLINLFGIVISKQVRRLQTLAIAPGGSQPDVWLDEFRSIVSDFVEMRWKLEERKWSMRLVQVAKQVAHDIRSPLSALSLVTSTLSSLPEDKRLIIRNATSRINDIANCLIQRVQMETEFQNGSSPTEDEVSVCMLSTLVDSVVSEKRVQFREKMNIEICADLAGSYGLFSILNRTELSRAISNIVNNSVEATAQHGGHVKISVESCLGMNCIKVIDNGVGIPSRILSKLGTPGVTYGKSGTQSGLGIGLSQAMVAVESTGGSMEITSTVGQGTSVTLRLPKADPPAWFLAKLSLRPGVLLVSVDDDQTIHQIWDNRLKSIDGHHDIQHVGFSRLDEFENWYMSEGDSRDITVLIDHEFIEQTSTGMETIKKLQLGSKAVLVSSHADDESIQQEALNCSVKILAKASAPIIQIEVVETLCKRIDAILLDDDELVRSSWQLSADHKGKTLEVFSEPHQLFAALPMFDRQTPIYLDENLGNGLQGIDIGKSLYDRGYQVLFLASGDPKFAHSKPSWIKGSVGKMPPWAENWALQDERSRDLSS